jgi:hypothetical protein
VNRSHEAQRGIGKVMAALNAVMGLAYLLVALFVTQVWWQVLFAAGWFGLALGWLATTRWRPRVAAII